jgi:hypothetical protein
MCWNALHILHPVGAHAIDDGKTAGKGDADDDKVEEHRLRAKNVRHDAMDETNMPELGGRRKTEAIDKEDARDRSAIADVEATQEARGAASADSEGITDPRDRRCEQGCASDRGIIDYGNVEIQCEAGALSSIFPSLPCSLSPPSPTWHTFPVSAGRAGSERSRLTFSLTPT